MEGQRAETDWATLLDQEHTHFWQSLNGSEVDYHPKAGIAACRDLVAGLRAAAGGMHGISGRNASEIMAQDDHVTLLRGNHPSVSEDTYYVECFPSRHSPILLGIGFGDQLPELPSAFLSFADAVLPATVQGKLAKVIPMHGASGKLHPRIVSAGSKRIRLGTSDVFTKEASPRAAISDSVADHARIIGYQPGRHPVYVAELDCDCIPVKVVFDIQISYVAPRRREFFQEQAEHPNIVLTLEALCEVAAGAAGLTGHNREAPRRAQRQGAEQFARYARR